MATDADCKDGIDTAYNGVWGYHPLVISLANTKEVLRLKNRPGNRPSHEGAAALLDECIALCRDAGFRKIVLRGDTDFLQTKHLDRWHEQVDVRFVFGYDCCASVHLIADDLPPSAWKPLHRPPKYTVQTTPPREAAADDPAPEPSPCVEYSLGIMDAEQESWSCRGSVSLLRRSFTHCWRPRCSSNAGAWSTTQSGRTVRCGIVPRPRRRVRRTSPLPLRSSGLVRLSC